MSIAGLKHYWVLAGMGLAMLVYGRPPVYPPAGAPYREYISDALDRIEDQTIKVTGRITDENGTPLSGVRIEVGLERNILYYACVPEREVVFAGDGQFEYECRGYTVADISFSKEGYLPESHRRYALTTDERSSIIRNSAVFADEEIVLTRAENLPEVSLRQVVWRTDEARLPVFTVDVADMGMRYGMTSGAYLIFASVDPPDGDSPAPYVYHVVFQSDESDDGLLPVPDAASLRDLPEAPASGYDVREVAVASDSEDLFFYYHCGAQYGKFRLHVYPDSGESPRVYLTAIVNGETAPARIRDLRSPQQ